MVSISRLFLRNLKDLADSLALWRTIGRIAVIICAQRADVGLTWDSDSEYFTAAGVYFDCSAFLIEFLLRCCYVKICDVIILGMFKGKETVAVCVFSRL